MKYIKFRKNKTSPKSQKRWPKREMLQFFDSLVMYMNAGQLLLNSLSIISSGGGPYAPHYDVVRKDISNGLSLAQALKSTFKVPHTIFLILKSGEIGGNLKEAIERSSGLIQTQEQFMKKCFSALTYPVAISVFSLIIVVVLMRWIMPQIIPTLNSLHVHLPLLTRFTMSTSKIITNWGLYILLALTFMYFIVIYVYKKSDRIRLFCQSFILYIPIVGRNVANYNLAIFLHSLGVLMNCGLSPSDAFGEILEQSQFSPLSKQLRNVLYDLERGVSVSSILKGIKMVPAFAVALISAGENTGTLADSFIQTSRILERDLEYSLKKFTALLEPALMAGLGTSIGAIALSIIMPIYDVSKNLQH